MKRLGILAILVILVTFEIVCCSVEIEEDKEMQKPSFTERVTSLLYVSSPTSSSNFAPTSTNWDKVKALFYQARSYVSPPNLDFRGSSGNDAMSSGEKVKEAAARSLEKSKVAVEDSAKTAAKIASETVQMTKEKVKKSVSAKRETDHQQSEL